MEEQLKLPSYYQIGDEVEYYAYSYEKPGGDPTKVLYIGTVTAVKFTKAKIRYDILNDETGYIDSVLSDNLIYDREIAA